MRDMSQKPVEADVNRKFDMLQNMAVKYRLPWKRKC